MKSSTVLFRLSLIPFCLKPPAKKMKPPPPPEITTSRQWLTLERCDSSSPAATSAENLPCASNEIQRHDEKLPRDCRRRHHSGGHSNYQIPKCIFYYLNTTIITVLLCVDPDPVVMYNRNSHLRVHVCYLILIVCVRVLIPLHLTYLSPVIATHGIDIPITCLSL